jgi:hypothetical protein
MVSEIDTDLDPDEPHDGFDLAENEATGTDGPGGTVVPLPSRTTLPPPASRDTPDTGTSSTGQNGSRTRTRKTPAPAGDLASDTGEPPVTGFGGVDVSDYV